MCMRPCASRGNSREQRGGAIIQEAGRERRCAMDEEGRALFRRAMRGVRRLPYEGAATGRRPGPAPRARFARAERDAVLQESLGHLSPLAPVEETGEALVYRRPHL